MIDCTTRAKFVWNPINKIKTVLTIPERCMECEENQRQQCIERSWQSQGRQLSELKNVKVEIVISPKADDNADEVNDEKEVEDSCEEEEALGE